MTSLAPADVPEPPAWEYDAAGNIVRNEDFRYTFDAAGRVSKVESLSTMQNPVSGEDPSSTERTEDGDGRQAKTVETVFQLRNQLWVSSTLYHVRSSVLGGRVVSEVAADGGRARGFVYLRGGVLAWQQRGPSGEEQVV